ncbi:hypothetical protein AVEN_99346-1 [Araneus ventricosus]|uniref:Uncharacterized protein n=1 Tax=Araneus ventricosus TaxID=182803 RepID=A0A4Y2VCA0_ARAVE|nr:hypothetical protein AVEN_99346-1 [Araneus ventricosus]
MCSNRRTIFAIADWSESAGISTTWRRVLSFRSGKDAGLLHISRYRCSVMEHDWIPFAVISSKTIRSNDKGSRKTTPYCNYARMHGLFLDSVRVFRCLNSTIVGVNVPIETEVGFVTPQNVP